MIVWDYKKADSKNIRKALDSVNWEMVFGINSKVTTLNENLLNIPNKNITADDKNPVWMNEITKSITKTKNLLSTTIHSE